MRFPNKESGCDVRGDSSASEIKNIHKIKNELIPLFRRNMDLLNGVDSERIALAGPILRRLFKQLGKSPVLQSAWTVLWQVAIGNIELSKKDRFDFWKGKRFVKISQLFRFDHLCQAPVTK